MGAALHDRLARIVTLLFLPVFFAYSGMRTEIGLLRRNPVAHVRGIIAVANAGKFGGTVVAPPAGPASAGATRHPSASS